MPCGLMSFLSPVPPASGFFGSSLGLSSDPELILSSCTERCFAPIGSLGTPPFVLIILLIFFFLKNLLALEVFSYASSGGTPVCAKCAGCDEVRTSREDKKAKLEC